ncbi:MAG: fasciclin domain-containing protein [Nitriliruptorales bacterium]|nr:fasciclin domain-containing protein [Nitriliruptorales bacterium]
MKKSLTIAASVLASLTASAALAAPPADRGNPGRPAATPSIVDVAVSVNSDGAFAGEFDTLISLLTQYPDLVDVLSQKGQYTVFAPTDGAFDALFAVVDPASLTSDQVKDVLMYHVAKGNRDAADVTSSTQIRMLNGDFAEVDGAVIDGANIIVTDVPADNGVIHAVDAVLLPPALG